MKTARHTPGPWSIWTTSDGDGTYTLSVGVRGGVAPMFSASLSRAETASGGSPETEAELRADARLIAAAPELLEALLKLEPYLSDREQALDYASLNEGRATDWDVASIRARAAIAKARGES